jgi:lysophospholipase L1-like esterase
MALPLWMLFAAPAVAQPPAPARIVFLGDSITDGNTYPLLIEQALRDAKKSVPVCMNAGVAGDTARDMRERLDRDVLSHKPTLVALGVGINDVLRDVKIEDFRADVTAIAERLKEKNIPLLVLTTTILGPKHAEADRRRAAYNAVLREVAGQNGWKLAEVNRHLRKARNRGTDLLEPDHVHLNFEGYRVLTRAVLDALGHKDVPVPKELRVALLPGVIREWRVRGVTAKEPPIDERTVRPVRPDPSWTKLELPEKEPQTQWWLDQERRRGFALSLPKVAGKAKSYLGVATIESNRPRPVYLNTGAQLGTIWLNGKRVFRGDGWTGWHAGKERIPVELPAGRSTIVIETGPAFFLSVTDR